MPYPAFVASCIPLRKMCSNSRVFIVSQTEFPLNKKLSILINNLFYTVCYNSERKKQSKSVAYCVYCNAHTAHCCICFYQVLVGPKWPTYPPLPQEPYTLNTHTVGTVIKNSMVFDSDSFVVCKGIQLKITTLHQDLTGYNIHISKIQLSSCSCLQTISVSKSPTFQLVQKMAKTTMISIAKALLFVKLSS